MVLYAVFTIIAIFKVSCGIRDFRSRGIAIIKSDLIHKRLDRAPKLPFGLRGAIESTFFIINPPTKAKILRTRVCNYHASV